MKTSMHKLVRQLLRVSRTRHPDPAWCRIISAWSPTTPTANSPQPILATVTLSAPPSGGTQATAAATTYDYNSPNPGAYPGGIQDIQVLNPGSGYTTPPTVTITGGPVSGGASATAIINGITGVVVNNGGSGYSVASPPTVTITQGTPAHATATGIATVDPITHAVTGITITDAGTGFVGDPLVPANALTVTFSSGSASATAFYNPIVGAITGFTNIVAGYGFDVPIANTGLKKFVDLLPGIPGVSSYVSTANGYTAAGATNLGQALPAAVPPLCQDRCRLPQGECVSL